MARSNKDLDQFASVVSHDLQEPLRTVRGFVQLLQKKYANQLDAEADTFIEYAVGGTKRMETLIKAVLTYARVGTRGREPVPIDSIAVLHQALDNLHESIQETGAEITQGELPTVRADLSQLAQLFQNLIGNALKFRSEVPPKIHVDACQEESNCWRFSVRDNGIGIESQFQDQIFKIFRRLHTQKQYAGTGIGLAVCKKIVDRHGGEFGWNRNRDREPPSTLRSPQLRRLPGGTTDQDEMNRRRARARTEEFRISQPPTRAHPDLLQLPRWIRQRFDLLGGGARCAPAAVRV